MAVTSTSLANQDKKKTAQDWVRQLRFSNNVNRQTLGVDTDHVTPELMLAASNKLLGISRGQQQGDQKDALQFQRIYGPVQYFAQRIQKDGGSVARSMLWKATNKGNVDFIGSGSLQPHINAVFNQTNLSQFVDNSTPLEGVDASQKVTRIGEGGISSQDSAPIQMRLVQPSYAGYVDPVRTAEKSPGITGYLTKNVLKGTDGKLYQKLYNVKTGQEELVDSQTAATKTVTTNEYMGTPDKYVYAIGGSKGVKIVPRSSVDYILPRSDDLFSGNSNLVPMLSGIKAMRLLMGCHHPQTPIVVLDKNGYTDIIPAKRTGHIGDAFLFGCDSKGKDAIYPLRNVVTRVPQKNSKFKTVVLESGRYLPTSKQHKWYIYDGQSFKLIYAKDLKPGMLVPRSMFTSLPVRTTEVMGVPVTKQICVLMGRLIRSLTSAQYNYKFTFLQDASKGVFQKTDIEKALKQLQVKQCNIFRTKGVYAVTVKDPVFIDWIEQSIGCSKETIRVPKEILSLPSGFTCAFLDSFYKDMTGIGEDGNEDTWILDLPNDFMRDAMSLMLSKIYTDTQYKDAYKRLMNRKALKLVPMKTGFGDVILEKIVKVYDSPAPAVMIDIDCDDNVYAAGNGIITHNSKYGNQAVPLQQREAPLVRSLDQATGMDTPTILGKLLGTQWAPKSGMVKAVREDRIDMLYDDGTEGSVPLYKDFPANAKGWLTNYPKVKAGDKVDKGALLATSNYTDDNGVLAMGRNLRVAYMSFHGGTYEDACVLSESAAKKMGYTTMYKTDMQKDKSIRTAKTLYKTWKPGQFSKQQFDNLDDQGVVKPGAVLNHGDPVILGIRTTEPSPGTLGKRILTDVTETWEHANPGVVTDVINTKNGIKVFAKVSSPLKVGDKISGFEGNKGTVAQIIPDDEMPQDSKGNPIQLLFDPLGIVSRTNPSQLMQAGLGKVAAKLGHPIIMPQFQKKGESRLQYVKKLMKDNNVPYKENVYDPNTGRTVSNVFVGRAYFMPLKHIADTKMSARGTSTYTAQEIPASGGQQGCFPAMQNIMTTKGLYSISDICENKLNIAVISWDANTKSWVQNKVTDWFIRKAKSQDILDITLAGPQLIHIYPTKNHNMYLADGTTTQSGKLKVGDILFSINAPVTVKEINSYEQNADQITVYDITVENTHNYCLSGGINVSNSKRLGGLQGAGLVGHNAFDFLKEAKLIRGQSNADFWRSIRTGQIPVMPGEPLVHKKFFATLQASGVNIQRNKQGVSIFALTNKDVDEMAKGRQLKSTDTYQQKNFRPIAGGLFGADIFGDQGTNWGYIQLDKPLPNPVMQEPLARLLRMSDQDFQAVIRGQKEVNSIHNSSQMKAALSKLDLQKQASTALRQLKQASPSRRDAALKRYVAIGKMRDNGVHPQQYMLDRIPVLPPVFRPISSHGGLTMVADSNYLYAQLLNARDDAREAKNLPAQYQQKAQSNIYDKWKQLVGLYDPRDVKLRNKNVKGLLKWALGKSSKWSAFQRKVLGSTVDTVGRGVVVPSTKIKLNEIGMPVQMAWNVYAPFVTRKLVQQGYSPVDAMKLVKEHSNTAKPALVEAVNERPVVMNRAPSLHKLSLMGFNVRLTDGHAIKTNPSIVTPFNMDFDGNCVDFDSKISLKLSKSALEIFTDFIRLETSQKTTEGSKEMRVSESSEVEVSSKDSGYTTYATLKIGKMPRLGTPVKDKNGADVYKMPEGVSVVACDPVTGEKGFYEVEALTVEDNCHTVKVEAGNHSVIISDNESMAVFDKHTGKLAKVRPADLEGYYVPVLKKSPLPFGLFGNRDIGWILGSLISDGWICNNIIGYAKLEEGKRAEVERIFRSINPNFVIHTYEEKGQNNGYKLGDSKKIHIYSPDLVSWLKQFELLDKNGDYTKKTACSKQISHWLLTNASEECLWGILSGLIDGDGSLVVNTYKGKQRFGCRYATSSPSLRDSLTELLYRLGIRYSITTTPPRNWSNEAYTICPSTIDLYRNIDKLSCIGNRETELINQWKKAAPVYEDKKDQVPVSDAEWEVLKSVVPVKSGLYCACISGKKNKSRTAMRSNLTPYLEFLKENVPTLYSRVNATDTLWYQAEVTEDMGNRQVFDLMVKDAKVFAVNNGFIVWDTVNLHVPVSKAAINDVRQKMMPERNLISMRKNKILYMPQKAYTQGLYVATRMDQKDQVHTFSNLKEAKEAYHKGQINVDTPIVIKET